MSIQNVVEKFSATIATVPGRERELLEAMARRMAMLPETELAPSGVSASSVMMAPIETEDAPDPSPEPVETEDAPVTDPGTKGGKTRPPAPELWESE